MIIFLVLIFRYISNVIGAVSWLIIINQWNLIEIMIYFRTGTIQPQPGLVPRESIKRFACWTTNYSTSYL